MIATGLDPTGLSIRTVLDGQERQNAVSDMIFQPHRLVSFLSRDMTLLPGDVIACGTSIGVSAMRGPPHHRDHDRGRRHLEQPLRAAGAVQVRRRSTRPMRIGVVGAGAIGGLMAAKLAGAGNPVTVIDQGAQLAAIQDNGLKLIWEDGSEQVARVKRSRAPPRPARRISSSSRSRRTSSIRWCATSTPCSSQRPWS